MSVAILEYSDDEVVQNVVYLAWRDCLGFGSLTTLDFRTVGDSERSEARFLRR